MRYLLSTSVIWAFVLGTALVWAEEPTPQPSVQRIELKVPVGSKQVQTTTLLETPQLKLVRIVIPKGGVLPAHAVAGPVSIQTISGTGELRVGVRSEPLDTAHLVVLAPATQHEVRATTNSELVLLVHEVGTGGPAMACEKGMECRGMAGGMGMGHGMGATGHGAHAAPAPAVKH